MSQSPVIQPEIPLLRSPWPVEGEEPFKWASPDVGNRSRLGGSPDEAIGDWPKCTCGVQMSFYGQLDSHSDEFCIADVGLIAVFLCFDCYEAKAQVIST